MDRKSSLSLFNKYMRMEIVYPGYRREKNNTVIRHISLEKDTGFVLYTEMNETVVDSVIDEQLQYFQQIGQPFEWKVFDYDKPLNLKDKLLNRGFTIEDQEALMILDLSKENLLLDIPFQPEIRRITDEEGIWDIVRLETEVWGTSHQELGERLVRELYDDSVHLVAYAAYVEGKVVSAAWMYLHYDTPFASLWGGSTLQPFRKKGYYSSLLGVRAREAAQQGFQLLMVDASSMSQPILEKHGFLCLAKSTPCMSPKFD